MRERRLQQVCSVLPYEAHVCLVRVRHCRRVEQRRLNCICGDELDHARQQQALELEATLVIRIGEDEESVLKEGKIVLLEEGRSDVLVCSREVVDDFDAHFGDNRTKVILSQWSYAKLKRWERTHS